MFAWAIFFIYFFFFHFFNNQIQTLETRHADKAHWLDIIWLNQENKVRMGVGMAIWKKELINSIYLKGISFRMDHIGLEWSS